MSRTMADSLEPETDVANQNGVDLQNAAEQLDQETAAPRQQLKSDFESLKSHFTQLRDDVGRMLTDALNTGRSSKAVAGEQARGVVDAAKSQAMHAKDAGTEFLDEIADRIRQNPATATLIAFGVGYIFAKVMRRR